jgi:hypothetical protein
MHTRVLRLLSVNDDEINYFHEKLFQGNDDVNHSIIIDFNKYH